ncbi:MAG: insulinase family protein [Thermodesulfovibrionales bacterium]|nr:insulinase family protein [Thermodesulfovibrionales bacterium]
MSTELHAFDYNQKVKTNGLTILHLQRDNIPAIAITILIDASPIYEPNGKEGLANLTAKLLLEGTKTRTARQIHEEIDYLGAHMNVGVNHDYTTLTLTVLKKDLEKAFSILSDVIMNPAFDEQEISRRKNIIIGSLMQQEEEPAFVAKREFSKIVFAEHPYARLVEGSKESLDRITRQDLSSFFTQRYSPNNSIISIAGDISFDEIEQLIEKHFKGWSNPKTETSTPNELKDVKKHSSPIISIINRDITQANIIFGHLGVKRSNPDFYALSVMNYILGGGGFASRLMKSVRDDLGLTYGISSHFSLNKYVGSFEIEVQTKNESASQVVQEIIKEIRRLQQENISEQELKDAKSFLIGSFPRRLETNRKIADFLALIHFYKLGNDYIKKYPDYINEISPADIKRVANKYLDANNFVISITGKKDLINLKELQAK